MSPEADPVILWRRLDVPGHESARLTEQRSGWRLDGTATFLHDGAACRLSYEIACDPAWCTRSARVEGWIGSRSVALEIAVGADGCWTLDGVEVPAVAGCIDIDLNFSPSTNLLPVRRLGLEIGQQAEVRAAWLRFPSCTLEPLVQVYRRNGSRAYRYESAGGRFVAELEVDAHGFVTQYPKIWQVESEG